MDAKTPFNDSHEVFVIIQKGYSFLQKIPVDFGDISEILSELNLAQYPLIMGAQKMIGIKKQQ